MGPLFSAIRRPTSGRPRNNAILINPKAHHDADVPRPRITHMKAHHFTSLTCLALLTVLTSTYPAHAIPLPGEPCGTTFVRLDTSVRSSF